MKALSSKQPVFGAGMRDDMHEQPAFLRAAADQFPGISIVRRDLRGHSRVILTGSGSAYHAALAGAALLCRRNYNAYAVPASEFEWYTARDLSGAAVIALSQSGGSSDVLTAGQTAQERGASLLAVTNAQTSPLQKLAHKHVFLNAGIERAVPATKTITAMLAAMFALATPVVGRAFSDAADAIDRALTVPEAMLRRHLDALDKAERVFVLGTGLGQACALESALKLKEAARIPAEGYSTGEFKHGVTVMVQHGSAAIVVRIDGGLETEHAIGALRRLGARVIEIGRQPSPGGAPEDSTQFVAACGALAEVQRIALDLASRRRLNPDAPPTLQKQVRGWL